LTKVDPTNFDMSTDDGRKQWEEWKKVNRK
jgi:hypothetical protein